MASHEQHTHRLLTAIEAERHVSQRSLARSVGIALGLTNLILRRLVKKGWVRMIHIKPNRVRYLLTPAGIAEKARMSRDSLKYSVRLYTEARARISGSFAALERDWPNDGTGSQKRVMFLGTGEIAEIGYVCLQETALQLVGVIDDRGKGRFFNVPVYTLSDLRDCQVKGAHFDRLLVMSFDDESYRLAEVLESAHVPPDRVHWL